VQNHGGSDGGDGIGVSQAGDIRVPDQLGYYLAKPSLSLSVGSSWDEMFFCCLEDRFIEAKTQDIAGWICWLVKFR
jgi:hypothetical protein